MSSVVDDQQWFCIRSTVGYEIRAAEMLSRSAPEEASSIGPIEVFCPHIRKVALVVNRKREITAAMFPGYFFVRFNLQTAARYINSRPGVIGLVRFGDEPTPVPDEIISELKSSDWERIVTAQEYVPGQRLFVREGPFAGMEVEFVASLNDGQRAILLLEYLHRQVTLVAATEMLESAA